MAKQNDIVAPEKWVVVKFHNKEEYATAIFSGTKQECITHAAYCKGLYHDVPEVSFGVYDEHYYESCEQIEGACKGKMYELLTTTTTI